MIINQEIQEEVMIINQEEVMMKETILAVEEVHLKDTQKMIESTQEDQDQQDAVNQNRLIK